jgi:hypothetical protein
MKKSFLRAAAIACLPYCAMGFALATIPAQAADKSEKAEAPKVSKAVSKFLIDCKKGLDSKDWKAAIAACEQAVTVAEATDYDKYLTQRFLGVAYLNSGDRAKAAASFVAVVKNPAAPPEDRDTLTAPAMSLASEANNNALVIELGQIAVKNNIQNPDVWNALASAYYQNNDGPNAITYAQRGIDAAKAKNAIPPYGLYQILAFSYDKTKDRANEVKAFELMARDYGKPDDWRYLLDFSMETLPQGAKLSREIAALNMYRLRDVVKATWAGQNYLEAEDSAHAIRSWGDSRHFLELGIAAGAFNTAKVGPVMNQINSDAKKDEPILPTVEKAAKNSKDLANVAEAYFGYARYADAIRAGQKAVEMGGAGVAEAKLVIAMSQVKMGDEAAAKQTLANFQGDAPQTRAAALWNVYLTRRYGAAEAAPAAK